MNFNIIIANILINMRLQSTNLLFYPTYGINFLESPEIKIS